VIFWANVVLFFSKAWAWTKKNWQWLLLPIGIILYLVGRAGGDKVVISGQTQTLHDADEAAKTERDKAQAEKERLEAAKNKKVAEVLQEHDATLKKLTDEQKDEMSDLLKDPQELNEYLLQVGKEIRG
jgi:hypothetical protein